MTSSFNKNPYIVAQKDFPFDPNQLSQVLSKTYAEIAYTVNARVIGTFEQAQFATGEKWFITGSDNNLKRQTFRQVYVLPAILAGANETIPLNITGGTPTFTRIYGTVITDAPDQRPIPFASTTAVTANIQIVVQYLAATPAFVVTVGGTSPNVTSGIVVLEYLLS